MSAPGNCVLTLARPPSSVQQSIIAGNIVRILMSFTDVTKAPADPSTVTAFVGTSYYDEMTLTPVHDSTGSWHADWDTTGLDAGTYYCDVSGAGTIQTEAEIAIKLVEPHL